MSRDNMHNIFATFILQRDSKVMWLGPWVDTHFSHGSGTSTESMKMTKLLQ